MKLLYSLVFLVLLFSCSEDQVDEYPISYLYDRTVNEDPLLSIVAEDGSLEDLSVQGGFQRVMNQYENGFVDSTKAFFYFEEFKLLSDDNIEITISSMGQTMTNQFTYSIEDANLIIPGVNTEFIKIYPGVGGLTVCNDVIVSLSSGGPDNNNPTYPYGIIIEQCDEPDAQTKLTSYYNSFTFNPSDTLGLLRYQLSYSRF